MALAQEWRTAVVLGFRELGFRSMASVTSTECGDKGGSGGGDKPGKHVPLPLILHGVSGKYATALYVTAVRSNALDPVRGDLEQVAAVANMNTLFSDFMRDPSVAKHVRMKASEEIFKETKFHEVSKNFMAVLAENGRMAYVPAIFRCYNELLMKHKGEVEVQVTTALELTATDLEEIKKALAGLLKKGQNVKITQRVDRSIIGGIVITIGDKFIDLSIDRRIKLMEKVLREAV